MLAQVLTLKILPSNFLSHLALMHFEKLARHHLKFIYGFEFFEIHFQSLPSVVSDLPMTIGYSSLQVAGMILTVGAYIRLRWAVPILNIIKISKRQHKMMHLRPVIVITMLIRYKAETKTILFTNKITGNYSFC